MGMLVPLISLPIRDPMLNLLAQEAINVGSTLTAMFILARFMCCGSDYVLVGTFSAACCLGLAPMCWFIDFAAEFYGVWLVLGLAGLVLSDTRPGEPTRWWKWPLAIVMLLLAHWVYSGAGLLLGPLVVTRFFTCGRPAPGTDVRVSGPLPSCRILAFWLKILRVATGELGRQLLFVGIAFVAGTLFLNLATLHLQSHTPLGSAAIDHWREMYKQLLENGWKSLAPQQWPLFMFGTALFGLVQIIDPSKRGQAGAACRAALALTLTATFFVFLMGTREWVRLNQCYARYTFPAIFLLQAALAILSVCQLSPAIKEKLIRRPFVLALSVLLIAALLTYHSPSIKKMRRDLAGTIGGRTADILAARCTHVAGDYWRIWPSVFHANLVLHDLSDNRTVWGVSYRSGPTRKGWERVPLDEVRIAVPLEDEQTAKFWLQTYGLPDMAVVEKRSTILVLRPAVVVLQERHLSWTEGQKAPPNSQRQLVKSVGYPAEN
jgi:hypothetical protein